MASIKLTTLGLESFFPGAIKVLLGFPDLYIKWIIEDFLVDKRGGRNYPWPTWGTESQSRPHEEVALIQVCCTHL